MKTTNSPAVRSDRIFHEFCQSVWSRSWYTPPRNLLNHSRISWRLAGLGDAACVEIYSESRGTPSTHSLADFVALIGFNTKLADHDRKEKDGAF